MVSRLTYEKQVVWAAEAVKKIRETHPEVALVIVGDGPLRSELAAFDFVKVVGWIKDPTSYLKGADLFLNTSLYEGYGRTLVEAAAAGVPIVTTDVGIAQEVVDENGIIVPVGDSEALRAAILSVAEGKFEFSKSVVHAQAKEDYLSAMVAGWEACLK